MAELRRFGLLDLLLFLGVVVAAGAARAGYLMAYCDNANANGPLLVQDPPVTLTDLAPDPAAKQARAPNELEALINNLKQYQWYGSLAPFAPAEEQTAHYSPGYPWVVAQLARVAEGDQLWTLVRWSQAGLGAVTVGVWFLFALRAFSSRVVALLTGLFCAVYPFWVIATAEINDGVLASFLLAMSIHLGARGIRTHGPFASLLYGLALAGLCLTRAAMLPFGFVALGWFLLRSRHESRGWLCALLAFLGFANGLAPWTVRNFQLFNEPVPVVDSAYLHLWIGNNPKATGGPATDPMWQSSPSDELVQIKSQPRRYAKLGTTVWDEVRSDPVQTIQRRIWAGLDFVFGERFFTDKRLADKGEPEPMVPHAMLILGGALLAELILALLGWRWSYGWRKTAMPMSLALFWVPLPYILSHAEALHGPRLPLDGVLLCYAAFALTCLLPGVGGRLLDAKKTRDEED
jgi:Dolichyl-phosphate-mannose-protein mannosyltransferase